MKGLPKYLNTLQDYKNAHALALLGDDSVRQAMGGHWQALLNSATVWAYQGEVAADYVPAGSEKVMPDERDGKTIYSLFLLVDDPGSKMQQLGLSAEIIESRMQELQTPVDAKG